MRLKLKYSRSNVIMWVPYYAQKTVVINKNRKIWKGQRRLAEKMIAVLSHEAIHLAINKIDLDASLKLDNLFSNPGDLEWEDFPHGLGDLDEVWRIIYLMRKHYAENMDLT